MRSRRWFYPSPSLFLQISAKDLKWNLQLTTLIMLNISWDSVECKFLGIHWDDTWICYQGHSVMNGNKKDPIFQRWILFWNSNQDTQSRVTEPMVVHNVHQCLWFSKVYQCFMIPDWKVWISYTFNDHKKTNWWEVIQSLCGSMDYNKSLLKRISPAKSEEDHRRKYNETRQGFRQ